MTTGRVENIIEGEGAGAGVVFEIFFWFIVFFCCSYFLCCMLARIDHEEGPAGYGDCVNWTKMIETKRGSRRQALFFL